MGGKGIKEKAINIENKKLLLSVEADILDL